MFTKKTVFITIVLLIFACQLQAEVIYSTWIGGQDGYWGDPSNWDPNIVPNNQGVHNFNVAIDGSSTDVCVSLYYFYDIDFLTTSGEVDIDINKRHTGLSYLTIENDLTNTTGADLWLSGDVHIRHNFYNQPQATVRFVGDFRIGRHFDNAGRIMVIPISEVTSETLQNTGQVNVFGGLFSADEIFDNNSPGVVRGFGIVYGNPLQNKGLIEAAGGTLTVLSESFITNTGTMTNGALSTLNVQFAKDSSNSGTISVNAGGGVAFDCNLVNEPSGVIDLLGGTLAATNITQKAGASFKGFGSIKGNLQLEPDAIIQLTGPTNIIGDVNIPAGATLEISDGQTLITGYTSCEGTIRLTGGTVIFQGGCDCDECNIIN